VRKEESVRLKEGNSDGERVVQREKWRESEREGERERERNGETLVRASFWGPK